MMENLVCWCGGVATRKSDMVCSFTIEKASFCWGKKKNRKLSERLVWKSARAKQKKTSGGNDGESCLLVWGRGNQKI